MLLCVKQNQSFFMVFLFENFDDIYSDVGFYFFCNLMFSCLIYS